MSITTRILSAIGLEKRSTIGVNGWPPEFDTSRPIFPGFERWAYMNQALSEVPRDFCVV